MAASMYVYYTDVPSRLFREIYERCSLFERSVLVAWLFTRQRFERNCFVLDANLVFYKNQNFVVVSLLLFSSSSSFLLTIFESGFSFGSQSGLLLFFFWEPGWSALCGLWNW